MVITVCVIAMVGCAWKNSSNKYGNNGSGSNSAGLKNITINSQDIYGFAIVETSSSVASKSVKGAIQTQSSGCQKTLYTISEDLIPELLDSTCVGETISLPGGVLVEFYETVKINSEAGRFFFLPHNLVEHRVMGIDADWINKALATWDNKIVLQYYSSKGDSDGIKILDYIEGETEEMKVNIVNPTLHDVCGDYILQGGGSNNDKNKLYYTKYTTDKNKYLVTPVEQSLTPPLNCWKNNDSWLRI